MLKRAAFKNHRYCKLAGFITVSDIIDELEVSDMTVRRDLDELDRKNRTYSRRRTEHILFH